MKIKYKIDNPQIPRIFFPIHLFTSLIHIYSSVIQFLFHCQKITKHCLLRDFHNPSKILTNSLKNIYTIQTHASIHSST